MLLIFLVFLYIHENKNKSEMKQFLLPFLVDILYQNKCNCRLSFLSESMRERKRKRERKGKREREIERESVRERERESDI